MASSPDLLARMRGAIDRVQTNPQVVGEEARAALEGLTEEEKGSELEATAAWVAGMASREANDLTAAATYMQRGIRAATISGVQRLVGRIRISHALVLSYMGEEAEALQELQSATDVLAGADRGHALLQLGLIEQRSGRVEEALGSYAAALRLFREDGDRLGELRLLINRGLARVYLGDFEGAESDLTRARRLAGDLDQRMLLACSAHNIGFLHGRRGDMPRALEWLEKARFEYQGLGTEQGFGSVVLADRAELLAGAGLVTEALSDAALARDTIAGTENRVELAESNLLVGRVALAGGDYGQASVAARDASRSFREQGRSSWATLADAIGFRGKPEVISLSRELPRAGTNGDLKSVGEESSGLADALDEAGWSSDALTIRSLAGRLWLLAGDRKRAVAELGRAASHRHRGPAAHRALGWQAEAISRLAKEDRRGARRAIRAGLGVVDRYRMTLAAADLRATVSSSADELASWLVDLALETRNARGVLAAAEAWRAGSLVAPVSPPPDAELERLLGRLRDLDADERQAGSVAVETERAALEATVRDRARHLPAVVGRTSTKRFRVGELVERVKGRLLVEFVESHGHLYAIWIDEGVVRMRPAGDAATAESEARSARGCLQRLATAAGSARSLAAAADTLATAVGRLADQLLGPVRVDDGRPIIIVPTGALHGVPWSALAPLAGASFVVSPSARSWLVADRRLCGSKVTDGAALLAAGPHLDGAEEEVVKISALHRDALTLTGEHATVESVLKGLEGASVAHLAAHGTFRTDNPLLSALRFDDGNLTVYDIERVPEIPATMILSACDAAAVRVHAGDELLGFSSTMLGLGAATVVAPLLPVADDVTTDLLVDLHRALVVGVPVSEALRRARTSLLDADGSETERYRRLAAAGSFIAMGA